MQQQALSALVAWVRLERAMEAFSAELRTRHGITALQHAVLVTCSERPQLPLAALRKTLVAHPATLGQAIDELRRKELVTVRTDPKDRRARLVGLTDKGVAVLAEVPLAGPVRLRQVDSEVARLDALKRVLEDAVDLFGLDPWLPGRKG
ncbi:MAG: MarR family transcriptional regulator [Devosia sp.]|nr:MarR family transcriptional regulator [Devosia sp.]